MVVGTATKEDRKLIESHRMPLSAVQYISAVASSIAADGVFQGMHIYLGNKIHSVRTENP